MAAMAAPVLSLCMQPVGTAGVAEVGCSKKAASVTCRWRGGSVAFPAPGLKVSKVERRMLTSRASFQPSGSSTGVLTPELKKALDACVESNKVVLFMKGNKMFPQCGFSNTCVQILNSLSVPYETVNILEDDKLRQGMKEYSNWPTFPQLYIDGEFFGGCDITLEAFKTGELKEVVEKAMCS